MQWFHIFPLKWIWQSNTSYRTVHIVTNTKKLTVNAKINLTYLQNVIYELAQTHHNNSFIISQKLSKVNKINSTNNSNDNDIIINRYLQIRIWRPNT